jgi:hypothetical protein
MQHSAESEHRAMPHGTESELRAMQHSAESWSKILVKNSAQSRYTKYTAFVAFLKVTIYQKLIHRVSSLHNILLNKFFLNSLNLKSNISANANLYSYPLNQGAHRYSLMKKKPIKNIYYAWILYQIISTEFINITFFKL